MNKILVLVICMFISTSLQAQVVDPVKWSFSAKKIADKIYEVHLSATIEPGWHIYSQSTPENGPVKTTIDFSKNPLITLQDGIKEVGKMEEHFEELFGVQVKQFSNKVNYIQKVVLKANVETSINGTIEFMTCNDHECLPPDTQKFSIALKK